MIINSKKRIGISWEIIRSLLAICIGMLVPGTNWEPDILSSVNKLARAVTKRIRTCDKHLTRLTFYHHHTGYLSNIAMWEALRINAEWECFRTPILPEILKTKNLLQEEHYAFLEVIHLFQ